MPLKSWSSCEVLKNKSLINAFKQMDHFPEDLCQSRSLFDLCMEIFCFSHVKNRLASEVQGEKGRTGTLLMLVVAKRFACISSGLNPRNETKSPKRALPGPSPPAVRVQVLKIPKQVMTRRYSICLASVMRCDRTGSSSVLEGLGYLRHIG